MMKFILCLFLACGLAADAAVYSNEFTANANPAARLVVTNIARAIIASSNGNWVAYNNGLALSTVVSNQLTITNGNTRLELKNSNTNTTATVRINLGDDAGQSYSWQEVWSTNRWYFQSVAAETDFALQLGRLGTKIGRQGQTTTNAGQLVDHNGSRFVTNSTGIDGGVNADATNAAQQSALGYFTNRISGATNVWQFASSGSGTTNSPFRGVEANIAFKPDTTYDWGGYVYAITNTLRLGHENSHHYGRGASILFYGVGFSNAVEFIATNRYTTLVSFEDFEIHGGTNATQAVLNAVYIDSMDQGSRFRNLKLMDSRGSGMHVIFSVLALYENIYVSRGGYFRTNLGSMLPPIVKPTNGVIIGSAAGGLSGASLDSCGAWACSFINLSIEDVPGDGLRVNTSSQCNFSGTVELCGGGVYLNNNSGITAEGSVFDLAMESNTTNDVLIVAGNRNRFTGYSGGVVRVIAGTGNSFEDGDYNIVDDQGANRTFYKNIAFNWRTNGSAIGGRWTWINCSSKQTSAVITNEWWNGTTEFKHGDSASSDPAVILRQQQNATGDLLQWMSYSRTLYGSIKSNGFVGLFTSAPTNALDVNAHTSLRSNVYLFGKLFMGATILSNNPANSFTTLIPSNGNMSSAVVFTPGSGVGIGTTNPVIGNALDVPGTTSGGLMKATNLQVITATASRVLMKDASGNTTNVTSATPSTTYLHPDGTEGTPAGGGSGGTNFPPVIANGGGQQASTNITVGLGVRQVVTITTNSSFKLVFTGTPLNGEEVSVWVSNTASSIIYVTNTAFNTCVASNDTVWPVAATSIRRFHYVSATNHNVGSQRWEEVSCAGKEMEIGAGGRIRFDTNAANSLISIGISSDVLTNLAGTGLNTNLASAFPTHSGSEVVIATAPTNKVTITNLVGLVHMATASVLAFDANAANDFAVTNRVTGNVTIVLTNAAEGQLISGAILGEASGGTDRTITIVPHLGQLVEDEDLFTTGLATSTTRTLTNGYVMELSAKIYRINGTNTVMLKTALSKF